MDIYTRHNSGQEWLDDVEGYANGRPERDPEIADYLKDLSNAHSPARVRRAANEVIYMNVTLSTPARRGMNVLQPISQGVSSEILLPSFALSEPRTSTSPVSTVHRWIWLILVVFSTIWGIITGASLFSDVGIDSGFALFGVMGNIVLALSLHRLGKAKNWSDR